MWVRCAFCLFEITAKEGSNSFPAITLPRFTKCPSNPTDSCPTREYYKRSALSRNTNLKWKLASSLIFWKTHIIATATHTASSVCWEQHRGQAQCQVVCCDAINDDEANWCEQLQGLIITVTWSKSSHIFLYIPKKSAPKLLRTLLTNFTTDFGLSHGCSDLEL